MTPVLPWLASCRDSRICKYPELRDHHCSQCYIGFSVFRASPKQRHLKANYIILSMKDSRARTFAAPVTFRLARTIAAPVTSRLLRISSGKLNRRWGPSMAVCLSSCSDRIPGRIIRSLNFNLDSLSYFSIVYETAILLICGGLSLHTTS